jgi:two-component system cell cycle response regulator
VAESVDLAIAARPDLARAVSVEDVGGRYLDTLRSQLGITPEIALVSGGSVVAQSGPNRLDLSMAPTLVTVGSDGQLLRGDGVQATVTRQSPGLPFDVVVALPASNDSLLLQTVALVILGGVLVAVVTARAIARDMTEPLADLTDAARAAATGDLSRQIEARGDEELRSLAHSFNEMTAELRAYITEVERSRDLVRGNVEQLGEALSATHDLDTLLPVVLESAMSSVGAGAGVVYVARPGGPLAVHAQHGLRTRAIELPEQVTVGHGILGRVAAGDLLWGEVGSTPELQPAGQEALEGQLLAVPLQRGESVTGLIALFDPVLAGRFVNRDVDELRTLARQAAIAVENVQLHAEAKQASITDPLTGQWNVRYLSMTLNQEVERATRFDRPLSLLMLDLDHFKAVNDTYGHARGDDVLREFARRVRGQIREVDTFARYGGEEFVLVLPETSLGGALRLADRILEAMREKPFGAAGEQPVDVTVSIGAAVFPVHGSTAPHLLRSADEALYGAKRGGRDRYAVADGVGAPASR